MTIKITAKPHELIMAILGIFGLGITTIATIAVFLTSANII